MDSSASETEASVLALQELVDRCMGNLGLVQRVLARFESTADSDLAELERAILDQDSRTAATVAHRLKGASANVAAERLRQGAACVERLAREGQLGQIEQALESLRSEKLRFAESVAALKS
jgi:HPt (histidine-containing phosphotransfer) domain-containing protein